MKTYIGRIVTAFSLLAMPVYLAACNFINSPPPMQTREPAAQVLVDPTYTPTLREATATSLAATPTLEEMTATPTPARSLHELVIHYGSNLSCSLVPDPVLENVYILGPNCYENDPSLVSRLAGPTINLSISSPSEEIRLYRLPGEALVWRDSNTGKQYALCGLDSYSVGNRTCKIGITFEDGTEAVVQVPVVVSEEVIEGSGDSGGNGGGPPPPPTDCPGGCDD